MFIVMRTSLPHVVTTKQKVKASKVKKESMKEEKNGCIKGNREGRQIRCVVALSSAVGEEKQGLFKDR